MSLAATKLLLIGIKPTGDTVAITLAVAFTFGGILYRGVWKIIDDEFGD